MIAAIASCIFVIYLYRSLNQSASDESSEPVNMGEAELLERLSALELRLRDLGDNQSGGASS